MSDNNALVNAIQGMERKLEQALDKLDDVRETINSLDRRVSAVELTQNEILKDQIKELKDGVKDAKDKIQDLDNRSIRSDMKMKIVMAVIGFAGGGLGSFLMSLILKALSSAS